MHSEPIESLLKRKNIIKVKPYNIKELAALYGVSRFTIKRWLTPFQSEIGERNGRYYTVKQVKVIFAKLDVPYLMQVA